MIFVINVGEDCSELKTGFFVPLCCAGLKRSGMKIDAAFVFGPIPFIAKAFDLVEVAGDDMGDLARLQFAFVIAKHTEVNRTLGAAEKLGQKMVAAGRHRAAPFAQAANTCRRELLSALFTTSQRFQDFGSISDLISSSTRARRMFGSSASISQHRSPK